MSTRRHSRLEVQDYGEITVVNFIDRRILEKENIQNIGEDLFSLVDRRNRTKILLDFSNVEYLSSLALGNFKTLKKKLEAKKGSLVMCCINEDIFEVFEITKLTRFFNIQKNEEAALKLF